MKILKKVQSQNNNEIQLIDLGDFCSGMNDATEQKTVLIIGVMHGDEPQGKFLIDKYLSSQNSFVLNVLDKFAVCKTLLPKNRLLFIPCLNPDGMDLKTRANASEIDINRNFPTKNWVREPFASEYYGGESPASEIETKFVMEILQDGVNGKKIDVILAFHSPYKVVNFDGPAKEIAQEISKIIGYPVQEDIGYPTPGSFGTYAGIERGIPIITLELDEEIDVKKLVKPTNKVFEYLSNI